MTKDRVVAIHQPNFLPWMGFFNKIARSDAFILLDEVQFPKTGGSWINHVHILVNGQEAWMTIPIVRDYHGLRKISEMEINDATPWRETMLKTLQMNYARSSFFKEIFPIVTEWLHFKTKILVEFNLNALQRLIDLLSLSQTELILQSSLSVETKSTDMLIDLVSAVHGNTYLCGGGAEGYQEDEKFQTAGIKLIYQNFQHPIYPQRANAQFVHGLSILDALMSCGVEETRNLLFNHPPTIG